MQKITIQQFIVTPSTELYLGEHLVEGTLLHELCNRRKNRTVIVADAAIQDRATKLSSCLNAQLIILPGGEQSKTYKNAEIIQNVLFDGNYAKDTTLIAMGGGVIIDLVGFVASIYMRGIDLILIPTTLLAMVDAAIGGKTAINTPFGKNLIGSIYPPRAIIVDLATLQTLPDKEWLNGQAEILKMSLICKKITRKDLADQILQSIRAKIKIIEKDPSENDLRHILNFGHTIGHALEQVSHYGISHGEAVAMGCLVESHLSMKLGYLSEMDFEQIQSMFASFPCKLSSLYDRQKLIEAMKHDKKNRSEEIRFVLIDCIGHAISFNNDYCRPVSEHDFMPSLDWMEKSYG